MVSSKVKKTVARQFKDSDLNLKNITKGANERVAKFYGPKYRMNTKKAAKELGMTKGKRA